MAIPGCGRCRATAVAGAALLLSVTSSEPAHSQDADGGAPSGLALRTQTFAVAPGASAHFEFVVVADVPEIVAPTTTTTTTTTTHHNNDDHHNDHHNHHDRAGRAG